MVCSNWICGFQFNCFFAFVNNYGNRWLLGDGNVSSTVIGCSHIEVEDVWVKGIPKLMTESAFRLLDVNKDGVLDILFGFATGEWL